MLSVIFSKISVSPIGACTVGAVLVMDTLNVWEIIKSKYPTAVIKTSAV